MRYILKYQRYPVMDIDLTITPHGVNFNRVLRIIDRPLLPFALQNVAPADMLKEFKAWYLRRLMPADRIGIELAAKSMSMTDEKHIEELDWKGALILMSILAYGRNMTDKYWLTPAKDTVFVTGMNGHGLNGQELKAKLTYKGLDFHKNGIAEDYGYAILKLNGQCKEFMDFNCPDFCTNGKEKKRFVRESNIYWLEKYVSTNLEEFREKAKLMARAHNEFPEIFQGFQFILNEDTIPIGYRTRCFTSKDTELTTLRDICLNVDYKNKNISKEHIVQALQEYISEENAEKFINTIEPYLGQEKMADNAGLLINSVSKDIVQKIAWL